jgi:FkbM family methyltransferase
MMRRVVEHLSRNLVFRRRLPSSVGGEFVLVSPDASLKFWKWDLDKAEPRLFDWAEEFVRPGNVVWDIGANVGLFAFSAASLSGTEGHIVAVEADDWLAELLVKSASMLTNKCARVDVLALAVSDSVGVATLNIAARGRSTNYLSSVRGSTQTGGIRNSVMVPTITLDWLLERSLTPDILKIDVEGAECQILQGARKLLSDVRPLILCEVSSENAVRVGILLESYSYELFDLDLANNMRRPLSVPSFNTLARFQRSSEETAAMVGLASGS